MTPIPHLTDTLLPEEAERQLRVAVGVELGHFDHPRLDRFLEGLPKTRASDLVALLFDAQTLGARIGAFVDVDDAQARVLFYSALLAVKDEIDRRLPIPKGAS